MIQFHSFCYYFDLAFGALIIGVLHCIGAISFLIWITIYYCNNDYLPTNFSKSALYLGWYILVPPVVMCIIGVAVAILMVYGSFKNEEKFILPFLILNAFVLIPGIFASWGYTAMTFIEEGMKGMIYVFTLNPLIILSVYFWFTVYFRWEEMAMENEDMNLMESKVNNRPEPDQISQNWAIAKKPNQVKPDPPEYSQNDPHCSLNEIKVHRPQPISFLVSPS